MEKLHNINASRAFGTKYTFEKKTEKVYGCFFVLCIDSWCLDTFVAVEEIRFEMMYARARYMIFSCLWIICFGSYCKSEHNL